MNVFFTVCTIRQLPQAFALGESLQQHHPDDAFVIGLCDDAAHLPAGFKSPYPLVFLTDLAIPNLVQLSQQYTPVEFVAACKARFMQQIRRSHPQADWSIYLDPAIQLYQPLSSLNQVAADATLLLTPHLLHPLRDQAFPDEKYFQNVGLYSSGFLPLRMTAEGDRFLAWWSDRTIDRAFIRFCAGFCTDQIWLALVPGLFDGVQIVKNPGWHVGLWNLHERPLQASGNQWRVTPDVPLTFLNFKGLADGEGYFQAQDRIKLSRYPVVKQLLQAYTERVRHVEQTYSAGQPLGQIAPAYGQQPTWIPVRGWRRAAVESLRQTIQFIDTVYVPRKMRNQPQ